ncbi:MAG: bifunctional phosphopantothenoylcysteine decarboxylase/phosphopantothenate--cysteine ligase CoaBC [Flavobacteriales bacterium]|nr:bifunctional phosphopantothenoylcysteine decarboxylase/phosphopantothenate--cysteine ligase CoaBC [Flavobacteriales bacterium]
MLRGKKVLLGVTGSIAAYKSAHIVREFIKAGAEVRVVMSPSAKDFVTPLTLSTLSKNPALTSFTKEDEGDVWNNHVDLGLWADLFVIAPATANSLSKMAHGEADNLLIATYLSAKCPVYIAPAMDLDMYRHGSTADSLSKLESYGNNVIPAESGELASGLEGQGRMAEPENIRAFIENDLAKGLPLSGKRVVITAGPTHEPIDSVRYIGNRSTGKMGIALATSCLDRGVQVTLILGPTAIKPEEHPMLEVIRVETAEDMHRAAEAHFENMDLAIASAAVSDFRPKDTSDKKIKKESGTPTIELTENPDILADWGQQKKGQVVVGFALETDNEDEHAKGKLERKNADVIVLNSLRDAGAGFGHDTNQVTIIDRNNKELKIGLKTKSEVAEEILDFLVNEWIH